MISQIPPDLLKQLENLTETEVSYITQAMSCVLTQLCHKNDNDPNLNSQESFFVSEALPGIDVFDYCCRLRRYMKCSPTCFVFALIYIDRFVTRHGTITVNSFTIHRLLFTSLIVACKFWDDAFFSNKFYAQVGGIPLKEVNEMEADLLFTLEFQLGVNDIEFTQYLSHLNHHIQESYCPYHQQWSDRPSFKYFEQRNQPETVHDQPKYIQQSKKRHVPAHTQPQLQNQYTTQQIQFTQCLNDNTTSNFTSKLGFDDEPMMEDFQTLAYAEELYAKAAAALHSVLKPEGKPTEQESMTDDNQTHSRLVSTANTISVC
jgi:hypothetical protein